MTAPARLPRILIIDDLSGRTITDRSNQDRANLCGQFLLEDVTGDEHGRESRQTIKKPIAQAVFLRGQQPRCAVVGDTVENDLEGTLQFIEQGWTTGQDAGRRWSMVLLDLCFYTGAITTRSDNQTPGQPEGRTLDDTPDGYFGLQLLRAIHAQLPNLPVVLLSSKPRDAVSHEFSTYGALGFLERSAASNSQELLEEFLWRHALLEDETGTIVGRSPSLLLALRDARRVALKDENHNLLIRGERGAGKELLARYVNRQSQARQHQDRPFITVNSAILTEAMFRSELFGHEKGAFTDAKETRRGLIQAAEKGDLFFDEIRDMVPQVQAGILRVLEEGTFSAVGSQHSDDVDVRFLSATNADIEAMSATGTFRADLLDRLRAAGTLVLPPLRNRVADIPLLAARFAREAELANPNALTKTIDPELLDKLCQYDWPGNVRELRQRIFQAIDNNPDVEHLVPIHVKLPEPASESARAQVPKSPVLSSDHRTSRAATRDRDDSDRPGANHVDEVIAVLASCEFDASKVTELTGRLDDLESAIARVLANYLDAALIATMKVSVDDPEGEVMLSAPAQIVTGEKLKHRRPADTVIRVLEKSKIFLESLPEGSRLRRAYDKARRQRKKTPPE